MRTAWELIDFNNGTASFCNCAHFTIEAFGELFVGNLEGYVAAHARIMGPIYLSHSSGADRFQDFIRSQFVAWGCAHSSPSIVNPRETHFLALAWIGPGAEVVTVIHSTSPDSSPCGRSEDDGREKLPALRGASKVPGRKKWRIRSRPGYRPSREL